ncbi:MAG: phage/plasmid primase, P4 family [bacterium]
MNNAVVCQRKINSIDDFLNLFNGVKEINSNQWQAKCTAHKDNVQSLSISYDEFNEKINIFCHAGCDGRDILASVGLDWSDLYLKKNSYNSSSKLKPVKAYNYTDENDNLLYQVVRYEPKTFRQRRPDGDGGFKWGLGNTRRVLYGLKKVIQAIKDDKVVYVVEGEKDADNLNKMGLIATTAAMGAGKWDNNYINTLQGAKVVIIPDNDKPGLEHAEKIASELFIVAKSVKIIQLPGLNNKEDVTDWINKGGTKELLISLTNSCSEYKPNIQPDSTESNDSDNEEKFYPTEIAKEVMKIEAIKGRKWAYVPETELLYMYDSKAYWRTKNNQYLMLSIREVLINKNPKWDKKYHKREVFEAFKDILISPINKSRFDAGENPNKELINVKNGMLDWKTDSLKEHHFEYYSQFQIPVDYKPDAECPKWNEVLKQWLPEKEARLFIQEFVGYCLIPDSTMHKAVILTGTGSNGKSTFLEVLTYLFGKKNLTNIPLHRLADRFETVNIRDKLVNICSDIDAIYLNETGILKTLIAGEPLRGEYKYGTSFDFRPVVRLIFSANEVPTSRDKTDAWYRRLEIVEFPNKFSKSDPGFDPDLKYKLLEELPGILNWSIEGLKRLKNSNAFTESEAIKKAKQEYERQNDSVIAFLEDCTEFPANSYEPGKRVYKEYIHYCQDSGLKPQSRRSFSSRLKDDGFNIKVIKINGKSTRCYYGLRLDVDGYTSTSGYT